MIWLKAIGRVLGSILASVALLVVGTAGLFAATMAVMFVVGWLYQAIVPIGFTRWFGAHIEAILLVLLIGGIVAALVIAVLETKEQIEQEQAAKAIDRAAGAEDTEN